MGMVISPLHKPEKIAARPLERGRDGFASEVAREGQQETRKAPLQAGRGEITEEITFHHERCRN